jgi:hypothetical protein
MTYSIPVADHVPTVPEEIFRAMQRKEMTEDEGHVFMGAWIASNLLKFAPVPYISMTEAIERYVTGRLRGSRHYDQMDCAMLMNWLTQNIERREENKSVRETLVFYRDKLAATAMTDRKNALTAAIARVDRNVLSERFDEALRVGRLDSEARNKARATS